MKRFLLALALVACGDDESPSFDVEADSLPTRPEVVDTVEPEVSTPSVTIHAAVALPEKLVALRIEDPEPISSLSVLDGQDVRFHRGRALVTLRPEDAPAAWGIATRAFGYSDLRIDDERVVAAGETLTIAAGTRVLMGPGARLVVEGTLNVEGTLDAPVLFTPDGDPWAAIDVRGGEAHLAHTWLVGGGADADRFAGHSGSDPVVAVIDGTFTMSGGGISDAVGKAFYTERSTLTLDDLTIARCDTGGEHVESHVTLRDSWTFEIPDADGVFDDDDNDGIYLRLGEHTIERSVFALGEDDGIDQNGATLTVRDTWIESVRHEGIATSNGGTVDIHDVVVRDAEQGIECGYGAPVVTVADSLVTGCGVGLRWGDEYDWEALGTIAVSGTVALHNTVDVKTDDPQQGEAPEGAVTIECSAIESDPWQSVGGNVGDGTDEWTSTCPPPLMACERALGPASCR